MPRLPSDLREYYGLLVAASAGGGFPSARPGAVGEPAVVCLYRGPGDCRCAAGLLIPDAAYLSDMERKAACHGLVSRAIRVPAGLTEALLLDCQKCHDGLAAECHGLTGRLSWDHAEFVRRLNKIPEFAPFSAQARETDT